MKQVLVTGLTGFIGRHIVKALINQGYAVLAVARNKIKLNSMLWKNKVCFIFYDIYDPELDTVKLFGLRIILIRLAWPSLPNYQGMFHFEENLPADYRFIEKMVISGVKHINVTGTCFEYGLQFGMVTEDSPISPIVPFCLAKDTLRKFLQLLQLDIPFTLQWIRLFHLHMPGQNPNNLIAQFDAAIDCGDRGLNISRGEQLRAFLPVEGVAQRISILVSHFEYEGIINCCSGHLISIWRLVEEHLVRRGAHIILNFRYYPYLDFEPMAFLGDCRKLEMILMKEKDHG